MGNRIKAPELIIEKWLNTEENISLNSLKGKVIIFEAFQMLCPGCVLHGMPLLKKIYETLKNRDDISIFAVHTVFEHHQSMTEEPLKTFLYEFGYDFPVAIDKHIDINKDPIPETMKAYNLRGTPSLVIINKEGFIEKIFFGHVDELELGLLIGRLLN